MATRVAVAGALDAAWASFNRYPPEAERMHAKEAWSAAFDKIPDAVFLAVMEEACLTGDRPPIISAVMERCAARLRAVETVTALGDGMAPADALPIARRGDVGKALRLVTAGAATAALVVDEVAYTEADGTPATKLVTRTPDRISSVHLGHTHQSAAKCPACRRHDVDENGRHLSTCRRCRSNARDRMMDVSVLYDVDFEPGFEPETGEGMPRDHASTECTKCDGNRFVERGDVVYPCSRCNPDAYARWADKHFMPGHDCAACSDVRRGVAPKANDRSNR